MQQTNSTPPPAQYTEQSLAIAEIEQSKGWLLLEFGENWCPICQQAQPLIRGALLKFPDIERNMIIDGKGKRLGRIFKVRLWPTLILLLDGQIQGTLVRASSQAQIEQWLTDLTQSSNAL